MLVHAAPHTDSSAMTLDDLLDQGQANTRSMNSFGRKKWFENRVEVLRGNTMAAVGDEDMDLLSLRPHPQPEAAAISKRVQCIRKKI